MAGNQIGVPKLVTSPQKPTPRPPAPKRDIQNEILKARAKQGSAQFWGGAFNAASNLIGTLGDAIGGASLALSGLEKSGKLTKVIQRLADAEVPSKLNAMGYVALAEEYAFKGLATIEAGREARAANELNRLLKDEQHEKEARRQAAAALYGSSSLKQTAADARRIARDVGKGLPQAGARRLVTTTDQTVLVKPSDEPIPLLRRQTPLSIDMNRHGTVLSEPEASSVAQAESVRAATTSASALLESRQIPAVTSTFLTLQPTKTLPPSMGAQLKSDLSLLKSPGLVGSALSGLLSGDIKATVSNIANTVGSKVGATIGSAFGPIGGAIGGALGGMVSTLGSLFGGPSKKEKEGREAYGNFGMSLAQGMSAGQQKELKTAVAGGWKGNEHGAATQIVLRDSYKAVGRSDNEASVDADRLFKATKKGADAVQAVIGDINKKLQEQQDLTAFLETTLPNSLKTVAGSGALVSAEFAKIVERIDATGKSGAAINEFVNGQATRAVGGIQAFLQNMTVSTQQSATAMAGAVAASFDEMTRRGMSIPEALATMQPTILSLQDQFAAAGFSGGEAFAHMQALAQFAADTVAGPVVQGVAGLNDTLIGLQNAGIMTQEMFTGFAGQVTTSFDSLVAKGYDGNVALQLMQPTLQTMWQSMADFGYQVDDSTGKLIAQAEQAGLVGDAHRSAGDVATKAMQDAAVAMQDVAAVLTRVFGDATAQATGLAHQMTSSINAIPDSKTIAINASINIPSPPDNPWWENIQFPVPEMYGMAEGGLGIVTRPTLFLAGEAGPEEFAFSGAGRRFARGGSGFSNAEVVEQLRDVKRLLRDQPRALKIAMQDAFALAGGR
jgi:hypothetical protein